MINHYIELHEYINENIYKFTNDTEVLTEAIDWNKFGVIGKGIKAIIDFIIKLFGKNNTASNGSLKQIRDEQANVIKESLVKLQMPQELMDTANKFANIQDYAGKSFSNLNNIDDVANLIGKSVAGMPAMIKKVNVFSTEFLGHMFSQIVNKDKKKDDKGTGPKYAIDDETINKLNNDESNDILRLITQSEKLTQVMQKGGYAYKIESYKNLQVRVTPQTWAINKVEKESCIFATLSFRNLVSVMYIMIRLLGLKNNFIYIYLPIVLRKVIQNLKLNDQPIISNDDYNNLGKLANLLEFDANKALFRHYELEFEQRMVNENQAQQQQQTQEAQQYQQKAEEAKANGNISEQKENESSATMSTKNSKQYENFAKEHQSKINNYNKENKSNYLKENLNYFAYFYRDDLIELFGVKPNEDVMTNIAYEIMFICAKYDQDLNKLIASYKDNKQELINKLEPYDSNIMKKNEKFDQNLNDQLTKVFEKYTKMDGWLKNPFGQAKTVGAVFSEVFKPEMRDQIANGLINQDKQYFQQIDQIVQKCFNDLMEKVKFCDLKIMTIYNNIRAYYNQNQSEQVDPELQEVLTLVMTEEGNMNNYKTLMDGLCRKLSEDVVKNIPEFMK